MGNNQQNVPPGAPGNPVQVNVNIDQVPAMMCKCGGNRFYPIQQVRTVPAVLSPSGRAQIMFLDGWRECVLCGEVYTISELQKAQEEIKQRGPVLVQDESPEGSNGNGNKV